MPSTTILPTSLHGTILETDISDSDIQRAIDAAPAAINEEERPPESPHSRGVMEAFKRAKKAGEINDQRSRRIVRQQCRERDGDVPPLSGQTALFDFGGGI